ANNDWVLTHNVIGTEMVQAALRAVANGDVQWNIQYPAGQVIEVGTPNPPPGGGPGGGGAPGGAAGGDRPVADEDWSRSEGRLVPPYAVLREGRELRVL